MGQLYLISNECPFSLNNKVLVKSEALPTVVNDVQTKRLRANSKLYFLFFMLTRKQNIDLNRSLGPQAKVNKY